MSPILLFSLAALALVAAALAFLLPPLLRGRWLDDTRRNEVNADLYRRDLAELEAEVGRGELPPEELQSARAELQRRLDAARTAPAAVRSRGRLVAIVLVVTLPLAAAVIYFTVGMPGALEEVALEEVAVEEAELPEQGASGAVYIARLQTHLARQPRDARGWVLLARALADRNEFQQAAASYEKALTASSKVAKDPGVLSEYADVLGMTQGGRLAGRPAELIAQALAIDPRHPSALDMAGSAAYAEGRYADSVSYWERLLAELPAGSARHAELSTAIERARRRAAVTLPAQ